MDKEFNYRHIGGIHYNCIEIDPNKPRSLFVCCLQFFVRMIAFLFMSPRHFCKVEEVFVVIPSANNKRSIQPILDAMKHKNFTCVERFYNFLPFGKIYLKSILHPRGFWKLYKESTKKERKMIRAHFDEFAAASELYTEVGEFYDYNPQIRVLIVSNDHMPIMLSFIDQARLHGIQTVYSQHASVSQYFPPLRFDYSFLDGQESFLKYKSIHRIEGKVFLVGSPRFDVITQLERHNSNLIGIAFNELDDYNIILKLLKELKANDFQDIVVRPHPQLDKDNADWSMFTNEGCEISHPLQENPFNFISRLSFLIAGASSIHLEAALLRIPSAIYNLQREQKDLDYYGYAKMKLTPIALTANDVLSLIKNPYFPSIDIIRYYDAAFGTSYDGKSSSLAAQLIDSYLDGSEEKVLSSLFEKTDSGYYAIKEN